MNSMSEELNLTPMDDTEFITDEDEKIRWLLENNKITIKEYNKLMKHNHKSQLNITGLSNISDLNSSNTIFDDAQKVDQSVLFGKDFVNTSNNNSDISMLKIQKDSDEKNISNKDTSDLPSTFSMSNQIEEFKKNIEENRLTMTTPGKKTNEDDLMKTPFKDMNRLSQMSDLSSLPYKYSESFDGLTNRESVMDTEINKEWESIVREATDCKNKKPIAADIVDRESQFNEFVQSKNPKARDTTKKYMRNQKGSRAVIDYDDDNNNFNTHFFIQSFITPDSSEEKKESRKILSYELILVILKLKNIHKNIISDFEQNRWKRYLLNFIDKNPRCEEAHFGLSQIYFSLGVHDKALSHVEKALEIHPKEKHYLMSRALYLFTMFEGMSKSNLMKSYYNASEDAALDVIEIEHNNLVALFILLNLSCKARAQLDDIQPLRPPEDYAIRIKDVSEYLGYIAWAEIYISLNKDEEAEEVLSDLWSAYPKFPHAFLKLWDFMFKKKRYYDSIQPIEELFVKIGDFYTIPEVRIAMVPLLYAKTLFHIGQYVFAFELLQNEFCKRPIYTVFLYFLGKFAVLSDPINFKGTAIGILQECMRSCVTQRKAKIQFYLGLAYKKIDQPLKAFDYFEKSLELYKNKQYCSIECPPDIKDTMNDHIKEFYDLSQLRHVVMSKAIDSKRKKKMRQMESLESSKGGPQTGNPKFQVSKSEIDNLKAAWKACVRADRFNGSLMRGIVATDVECDPREAINVYETMIEKVPENAKAYFDYYRYLKKLPKMNMIDKVTEKMMKAIEDTSVATDEWMEAHILRADALVALNRIDEAIQTLEKLVHIIPPLPIPGLSYFQKLEQKQTIVDEEDEQSPNGAIRFTYDSLQPSGSYCSHGGTEVEKRKKNIQIPEEDEEDEEEKGAIKIKLIPSEDWVNERAKMFKEIGRSKSNLRNSRPFSSSLFLSSAKVGVSLSVYL